MTDPCSCCDTPGYHFDTLDQLRDWLSSPYREEGVPLDVTEFGTVGGAWDDAAEASEWLESYDRETEREVMRDWILEHSGARGRI